MFCYSAELCLVEILYILGEGASLHEFLDDVIGVGVFIDLENSDDVWVCHTHQDVNFILLALVLAL